MSHESAAVAGCGKITPRERILQQPQNYIGSVDKCTRKIWVLEGVSMAHRMVTYVPGLFKIFDEILVYAADNKQRDPAGMDSLNVAVDVAECRISICYNGRGVPIELHPEEGVYMPEMIFGNLSGSCEEIAAGGRSSCGVKLANLFSTEFVVEIVDSRLKKKYKQVFTENMGKKSEPEITDCLLGVNWTKITFKPDLAKFHMTHIDDDAIALMRRRVADMAGFLGRTVEVMFNSEMFEGIMSFPDYVVSYISTAYRGRKPPIRVSQRINDQLEVCVTKSEGNFQQIAACIVKECSNDFQVEESEVKGHLWVFVNASMDNPTFDSPTRDALTNPQESFGSSCELSSDFLGGVYMSIIGEITPWARSLKKRRHRKERGLISARRR